jgi:outer membrane protein assembly factor BamB
MQHNIPRRGGWVLPCAIIGLFLVFAGLAVYEYFVNRTRNFSNQALLDELADAIIVEDKSTSETLSWPQWRGPYRYGVAHEPKLLQTWPKAGPKQVWQINGGTGFSSLAVGAGRVFTLLRRASEEVVMCWDAGSGKEIWHHAYAAPVPAGKDRSYPGPRATPTLDGERVYTVGEWGRLLCLEAATGKVVWEKDLLAEGGGVGMQWGFAFSPLVEGDLLLTTPGGRNGFALAAFNKKTGDPVWKALDDPAGYSSPISITVDGVRQVVFFTGSGVLGVAPHDGTVSWRFPWLTDFHVNAATPLFFQARKGKETLSYVFVSSGYARGCVLLKISSDGKGHFQARRVYENNQLRSHFASPVRYRDHFYGIDEIHSLTCMDLRTGKVKWTKNGFQKGSLLRVDGDLLVLNETGTLALVAANPERYEEKARAHVLSNRRSWTLPALAGGRLYLRDENAVKCVEVAGR